jgi:hypothetical protein
MVMMIWAGSTPPPLAIANVGMGDLEHGQKEPERARKRSSLPPN